MIEPRTPPLDFVAQNAADSVDGARLRAATAAPSHMLHPALISAGVDLATLAKRLLGDPEMVPQVIQLSELHPINYVERDVHLRTS